MSIMERRWQQRACRKIVLAVLCAAGAISVVSAMPTADEAYPFATNIKFLLQTFTACHGAEIPPARYAIFDIDRDGQSELLLRSADNTRGVLFACSPAGLDTLFCESPSSKLEIREHHLAHTTAEGSLTITRYYEVSGSQLRELRVHKVSGNSQRSFRETGTDRLAKAQMVQKVLREFNAAPVLDFNALDWQPLATLGMFLNADGQDPTIANVPVFLAAQPDKNRFTARKTDLRLPEDSYNAIAFKRMSGKAHIVESTDTTVTFALDSIELPKTMFRGYAAGETFPLLVNDAFLASHTLLQYTRWKSPEAVQPMPSERKAEVEKRYGNRKAVGCRWMAETEDRTRVFYALQLEPRESRHLALIVCFTNGKLASIAEFEATERAGRDWLWQPGDKKSFFNALPEMQALCATPEGFEIYLARALSAGRIKAAVLREFERMFLALANQE